MSGGVDSTVAAFLLNKRGYDVTGVFMKFWHEKDETKRNIGFNRCCSADSYDSARNAAHLIGIPIYSWNFETLFKKKVVDEFINEYRVNRTPNPCVGCNREIKFGEFYKKAKHLGADFIATGHYVRKVKIGVDYFLKKGIDKEKDQSYFLWNLKPEVINHCLFPLGNLKKTHVKKIASDNHLPISSKESQEICFIDQEISSFLKKYLKVKKGMIKDLMTKKILGAHPGLINYTIGQRSGLGLAGGPWYVVKKDLKKNILWITNLVDDLFGREIMINKVNWLVKPRIFPLNLEVKPRYRSPAAKAKIIKAGINLRVIFKRPQKALTPGQSAVFYKRDILMGGGIIV